MGWGGRTKNLQGGRFCVHLIHELFSTYTHAGIKFYRHTSSLTQNTIPNENKFKYTFIMQQNKNSTCTRSQYFLKCIFICYWNKNDQENCQSSIQIICTRVVSFFYYNYLARILINFGIFWLTKTSCRYIFINHSIVFSWKLDSSFTAAAQKQQTLKLCYSIFHKKNKKVRQTTNLNLNLTRLWTFDEI